MGIRTACFPYAAGILGYKPARWSDHYDFQLLRVLSAMPVVSEQVHPAGLSFASQRLVVIRRDVHGETWATIAAQVQNLRGEPPTAQTVRNVYKRFSVTDGRAKTRYAKCGRKKWKVTPAVERFLLSSLRRLRLQCVCTSATLQHVLAHEKGVQRSQSYIRKVLVRNGFHWLPRSQKRRHDGAAMTKRMAFARRVLALSNAQLRERLSIAMDGVVLSMPPTGRVDRWNHCRFGETHMWRQHHEAASPALAGNDPHGKQVPPSRAIPLWGGVSAGGFAIVRFHQGKKLSAPEWVRAVSAGKLRKAITSLSPVKPAGPWWVLCDNESFLTARQTRQAYRDAGVALWQIPPRSPDLNPVEKFWSWLRRKLRAMDLKDAVAKRPVLGKMAYKSRVRSVASSQQAQRVAKACTLGLKKVCREVIRKKGAATTG